MTQVERERIGFYLVPAFSMMALSAATEPLRAANRISGRPLYSWHLIGQDREPVRSSSGLQLVPEFSIDDAPMFETVIVVASLEVANYRDETTFNWLRRLARHGCRLGAISTAPLLLARAGLLDGFRCTIHWEILRSFVEEFPDIQVTRALYCVDRNRFTCAGGTAALDLMLALIAERHGRELAAEIAENFLHTRIRPSEESQRMAVQWRYGVTDRRVAKAIAFMEQNIESAVSSEMVSSVACVSPRQLERLFRQQFGKSPRRFYLELRLKHAQLLLQQSTDPIADIALKCGFSSASHLGRAYRELFGGTPASLRRSTSDGDAEGPRPGPKSP